MQTAQLVLSKLNPGYRDRPDARPLTSVILICLDRSSGGDLLSLRSLRIRSSKTVHHSFRSGFNQPYRIAASISLISLGL